MFFALFFLGAFFQSLQSSDTCLDTFKKWFTSNLVRMSLAVFLQLYKEVQLRKSNRPLHHHCSYHTDLKEIKNLEKNSTYVKNMLRVVKMY